jgi:L-ribulose-5-phosphate 4-epimerase
MSEKIKFRCESRPGGTKIAPFDALADLNTYRRRLLQLRLIGVDSNGIGFGNLSVRNGTTNNFYITGSATAGISELTLADCAKVVAYDFERNWLQYEGSATPSSESLTHAAVYESDTKVGSIIHCHDSNLWRALLNEAPATSAAVEYGTPEMAHEVMRLFKNTDVKTRRILVMTGHEGGVITFGRDFEEAFAVLIREWNKQTPRVLGKRTGSRLNSESFREPGI